MFNFFKDFFGHADSTGESKNFQRRENFLKDNDDLFSRSFSNDHDQIGFNVFTNPLEMHRYFESQLNNMLKNFGILNEGTIFGFGEIGPDSFSNSLEGPKQQPSRDEDLREQYLKPGFQKPHSKIEDRTDNDVDGKINPADLDSIFSGKINELTSYDNKPKIHSFGKQIITRMFSNHNGVIESHKTVKDNLGNEETIITHKHGDQEYTKIIKVDKDGRQEIKENFLNMSEKDIKNFLDNKNVPQIEDASKTNKKQPNWFPFDKYFK